MWPEPGGGRVRSIRTARLAHFHRPHLHRNTLANAPIKSTAQSTIQGTRVRTDWRESDLVRARRSDPRPWRTTTSADQHRLAFHSLRPTNRSAARRAEPSTIREAHGASCARLVRGAERDLGPQQLVPLRPHRSHTSRPPLHHHVLTSNLHGERDGTGGSDRGGDVFDRVSLLGRDRVSVSLCLGGSGSSRGQRERGGGPGEPDQYHGAGGLAADPAGHQLVRGPDHHHH